MILDVGCGVGRYLIPLNKEGHEVIGVDANYNLVNNLRSMRYRVYHTSEIEYIDVQFDYIIMSHVIEHVSPSNIIKFIDGYLKLLKPDGELIIATPLMYDGFYNNYDHVRPYPPQSIQALYSDEYGESQEKPAFRMEMKKIWIRYWPIFIQNFRNVAGTRCINGIMLGLYIISLGIISRKTGWVGIFQLVQ
jgi:SAM-dependent methyltransferase